MLPRWNKAVELRVGYQEATFALLKIIKVFQVFAAYLQEMTSTSDGLLIEHFNKH